MEGFPEGSFECSCGRTHNIPIKDIIIERGALNRVPELLADYTDYRQLHLVTDRNTYQAAGRRLKNLLERVGYQINIIILKPDEGDRVKADTASVFEIMAAIEREGYLVACGSGTINDLTRFVSAKTGQPYLVAGTAPSMDGYASSVSPITVRGVKKTFSAVTPEAVVADLEVMQQAPWYLIQAGFGDLLGKITSLLDWQLGRILFDEYYCEQAVELVTAEVDKLMKIPEKLKQRDPGALEVLIRGLINSGLAIHMAGYSRPASGSEHHISHFLEMHGLQHERPLPPHGIKVGLGLYFASKYYLQLKALDFSQLELNPNKQGRQQRIKNNYGNRSRSMLEILQQRWEQEKLAPEDLLEHEAEIKKMIEEATPRLNQVEQLLKEIGILNREEVKSIPIDWIGKALKSGLEIRNRFTVSTLLRQLDLLDDWSDELLEQYQQLIK